MSPSKAEKPETKPCLTMPLRAVSPVSAGLNQKDIRLSANEASTSCPAWIGEAGTDRLRPRSYRLGMSVPPLPYLGRRSFPS
jgi:hypothetical protein